MRVQLRARSRRLAMVLAAAVGVVVAASASPALAASASPDHPIGYPNDHKVYLALGDSVPFGYHNSDDPSIYANPYHFVGYPELLGREKDLRVLNASCPGETTDSFIHGAAAQSNGCENSLVNGVSVPVGYRTQFPLHVQYASPTQTQLDYAVDVVKHNRNVGLVSIMVGANDAFLCQKTTADQCTSPAEIAAVTAHVKANLDYILSTLRTQGHYSGRIVVVTYYAINYSDPSVVGTQLLDQAMAAAAADNHASVADGFAAFAPIAARAGGDSRAAHLVRPAPDVHPTGFGQWVLSEAVEKALQRY